MEAVDRYIVSRLIQFQISRDDNLSNHFSNIPGMKKQEISYGSDVLSRGKRKKWF